jgi:hypothetical protein
MSIWVSWESIGYDIDLSDVGQSPVEIVHIGDRPDPNVPERGEVRTYCNGWSNHYPTTTGEAERRANVGLSHIPVWCVPGHEDNDDEDEIGEWVRLDLFTAEHDFHNPTADPQYNGATVVMDEAAARALAADLLEWADRPKAIALASLVVGEAGEDR